MATPNSSVNWSTVLPDSSTARFTAAAFVDQWEYSMMWLKASSTVKVMPAFCWSFEPTMKGPPAMEPLETPTSTPFSMTMTDLPARTASTAAHMPAPPAPTMAMSHSLVSSAVCMAEAAAVSPSPVSASLAADGACGAHPARAAPAPRAARPPRVRKLRRETVLLLMVLSLQELESVPPSGGAGPAQCRTRGRSP